MQQQPVSLSSPEEVVIRTPRWGKTFKIPTLAKGQCLRIALNHGGVATLSAEELAGDRDKAARNELTDIKVGEGGGSVILQHACRARGRWGHGH